MPRSEKHSLPIGDFADHLRRELERRCRQNPRYSLRAFAGALSFDSSRLSKILRGERPVSPALIDELAPALGLNLRSVVAFKSRLAAQKFPAVAQKILPSTREYFRVALDGFEIIADFHHYAILELMKTQDFRPDASWLAKRLRISKIYAQGCVDRLVKVGLLSIEASGEWRDLSRGFSTHVIDANATSLAHRRHQDQVLDAAKQALATVPIADRDQSSLMMATSHDRVQEAKRRIQEFRRQLCDYLEEAPQKDAVFQLSVSLFPLTGPAQKELPREK